MLTDFHSSLWSPDGIGQTIIFFAGGFCFMVALCNRADHYIFALFGGALCSTPQSLADAHY